MYRYQLMVKKFFGWIAEMLIGIAYTVGIIACVGVVWFLLYSIVFAFTH